MLAKSFWRVTALTIFVAFLITIQSSTAQQSDDLETLQRQVQEFDQAGKHAEALALMRRLAAEIENAETTSGGKPGARTVNALGSVAWYALLAHDFEAALAASDRAHALDPSSLDV